VEGAKAFTEGLADRDDLGFETPDDRTFIVRLDRICPYFEILAAFYPLFPTSRETTAWLDPAAIVTNGPFRMQMRLLKDRIRLIRNPHYWDAARVKIDTIDALAVTSSMTALNLYLTGDVDWINNVPPVVLPFVKDREDFTLSPNLGTKFLRLNTTVPPLDDVKVRQAIHLAVDKASLTRYVLKGGQHPATSFVPPGIPGYIPPVVEGYDPAAARALLAEAGFPGGIGFPELNLLYIANETSRDIAEVVTLQLRTNLKISIHPAAQERKGYFVSQNSLSYDLCLCSWLGDYLDASTFLDVFRSNSGNNRTGWKNRRYDTLLESAAGEMDPSRRARLMAEAERLLLTELPLAPLWFRTTANMIKKDWMGYHDNIQDVHPLKYMERR
jgi:oligopeptide transport system substrate-binding protein